MAANSSIEWTDATWNPVTGCTRVSRGCDLCYAATLTRRLAAMGNEKYTGLINGGKSHFNGVIKTHLEALSLPLDRTKPTVFFVNSMSDLFHRGVDVGFIVDVFEVMAKCPQHTFQVLTKRPERMADIIDEVYEAVAVRIGNPVEEVIPLPNVWLGTSVEDMAAAETRVRLLARVPAAVRFLSCEPLLEGLPALQLGGIHWVIVGGESGHGAREIREEWVREIKQQCEETDTLFFFKQWGGSNKKASGRLLDGRTWDDMPPLAHELLASADA